MPDIDSCDALPVNPIYSPVSSLQLHLTLLSEFVQLCILSFPLADLLTREICHLCMTISP